MKNKNIIKSFDKILPNDECKKNILNNIIENRNRKSRRYLLLLKLAPTLCILLIVFISTFYYDKLKNQPLQIRMPENEIIYRGICYMEKGLFNENIDDLEFIEETKEFLMGNKIYKKGNSIIFKNNDNLIEYVRCERKEK